MFKWLEAYQKNLSVTEMEETESLPWAIIMLIKRVKLYGSFMLFVLSISDNFNSAWREEISLKKKWSPK